MISTSRAYNPVLTHFLNVLILKNEFIGSSVSVWSNYLSSSHTMVVLPMRRPRRSLPSSARPKSEQAAHIELALTSDPVLVGPGKPSRRHDFLIYEAVDYRGTRFHPGDHVSMYTPDGDEWVCILEVLFRCPETNKPMFSGRWFWSVSDIEVLKDELMEKMRSSKCKSHELIASDKRDTNLVETISRKCAILSYENFRLIQKIVTKSDYQLEKVFFCERQYYHKAYRFSELNSLLFPGDPMSSALRKAAGLPDEPPSSPDDNIDLSQAYYEPTYSGPVTKRKSKGADKSPNISSDPVLLW